MIFPINPEWLLGLSADQFKTLRSRIEDIYASVMPPTVYECDEDAIEEIKAFHADAYIKAENRKAGF